MINVNAITNAPLKLQPYPYIVVKDAIESSELPSLLVDFPEIAHPGSIPLDAAEGGENFKRFIDEIQGNAFRQVLSEKFSMDLHDKPTLVTLRGQMRMKDGRIHTDSKTKLITVLIYLNDEWTDTQGHLRILNNGKDIEDYVEEIPPAAGTMVIFKVTDNCWHGHLPVVGKRQSIQLNFLTSAAAQQKHNFFHGLSAKVKKLLSPA